MKVTYVQHSLSQSMFVKARNRLYLTVGAPLIDANSR
jgi:hypothetical protein